MAHKVVQVGDDVIAFPGDMEDVHISRAIKSFRDAQVRESFPDYSDVPAFLRRSLDMSKVEQVPATPKTEEDRRSIAGEKTTEPYRVNVFAPDLYGPPVLNHELTHTFQGTRNKELPPISTQPKGPWLSQYNYGGIKGLLAAQREGKTVSDFNSEQQADMVKDYKFYHDQYLKKAAQGKLTTEDKQKMYELQQAYHPFIRQLAAMPGSEENLKRNPLMELLGLQQPVGIDTKPEPPGLPSYDTPGLGMLPADPLMGGRSQSTDPLEVVKSKAQALDERTKNFIGHSRAQRKILPTTEESEHARQLKAAQPLSTAIPSLPSWATTPVTEQVQKFQEAHPKVYGADLERQRQEQESAKAFSAAHPVAGGVVRGVSEFGESMTSPVNAALALGAPESKILSAFFTVQALRGSYKDATAAREAYERGNNAEAARYATEALLGAGVAGLAGSHAYKGLPEGVRARLASEEGSVGPQDGGSERRSDSELRKRISEMSPEEMRKMLLTSDVVDLPNKRSFQEDQHFSPMAFVGRSDADGLKAFNDKFGYEKGDELLRAKADALKEAGLNAYHEKGDEFLYRGNNQKEIEGRLEKARQILRNKVFDVTLDDGTHLRLKGVDFSYGIGKDLKEAKRGQDAHKAEREAAGKRKRGELGSIVEVGPEADSADQSVPKGGASTAIAKVKPRTYQEVQDDIDKAEGELEKSGQEITRLYFPEHADVLKNAPGWKPMPESLVKLYAERDAIGSGQLKESVGKIVDNLQRAGIKDDKEIRHLLEYYALDPNRTDSAKQYLAAEHTQGAVDSSPLEQVKKAYSVLAAERGIPMDDYDDLWRDKKTTQDAIAAVKAIHSYFYPGLEINMKGLPSSLDTVKEQARQLQDSFRNAGLTQ